MGESKAKKNQKEITALQLQKLRDDITKSNALYGQLQPFGTSLLNMGSEAMKGNAPAYFQNAILPSLESGFKQAGENLVGFFGSSGQGTSGLAAGPWAHLQSDQANSIADAKTQAILQALNLGFQGSNVLGGQQSFFNPNFSGPIVNQSNMQLAKLDTNPWMKLLGGLGGAALGAIGGPIGSAIGSKIGGSISGGFGGGGGGSSYDTSGLG